VTADYTGTFTGTSTLHGTLIVHADGSASFHDVETFTGTVDGVPGTVDFVVVARPAAAGAGHAGICRELSTLARRLGPR